MTTVTRLHDCRAPSPEHDLWLAVLKQVLRDALDLPDCLDRDEARRWLTQGGEDVHLICGFVNIDAVRLTQEMRALADREQWFEGGGQRPGLLCSELSVVEALKAIGHKPESVSGVSCYPTKNLEHSAANPAGSRSRRVA